ncbi:MAG: carboxy-S-adenosyl-L-methionine synthase CmoA [Gammaproteobacteria bacterium]
MTGSDKMFAKKRARVADFVFDARVAAVFPDMIRRSVPGYETLVSLLGVIAAGCVRADSNVYDLGCSLGAAMLAIHARIDAPARFIGIDNSASMLRECRKQLDGVIDPARLQLLHCDVTDAEIADASMVVLNFTLQFLDPAERLGLLARIHAGMRRGGALVLSEKVNCEDASQRELQHALHRQFKAANGYSELEIAQKRAALENVMTLDSEAAHIARLRRAGFARPSRWFQAFNFVSMVAYK